MDNNITLEDDGQSNIAVNLSLNFVSLVDNGANNVNVYFTNDIGDQAVLQYLFQDGAEFAFQNGVLYEFNGA